MTAVGQDVHVGRVLNQRYRLISAVGSGASARVYLAEDLTLRRRVAVKLLHNGLATDTTFRKRFRAEAHASAQLSHPNIMAVYDWSEAAESGGDGSSSGDDPAYLVTELLTGGSLRSMLDAGHRLSLSQALIVGLHAAEGLAYAHYNGFVHRDIKPANLLFGSEGRLRLADFGIARAVAEAAWTEPDGALVGTARYAAPEQASGSRVDGRADVYALAVTIIEAVTGSAPLTGPTPLATMVLRQETDLVVPDELGPLAEGLRAAGTARVEDRSTAEELAWSLRSAASGLPRPEKLPLTGLVSDQRSSSRAVERAPANSETGVLVLDDAGPDPSEPRIDLSATASGMSTTRALPAIDPPIEADEGVAEVGGDELLGAEIEEDTRRQWPIIVLLLLLGVGAVVAYRGRDSADVSSGAGETAISDVTHPVGTFVGRQLDDVTAEIERNGWTYVITDGRQDGAEVGDVLEQAPVPGTEWAEGLEITLVVSVGGTLQVVPELVGLQLEVALAELAQAGLFLGGTAEAFDEQAPSGQVLSASPEPGTETETGTAVDLVWSVGPTPREIPDFSGDTLAEAQADLDELGLTYVVTEEHSQTVPEGEVIATSPSAAASVARGSEVTIVVSLGLPFIEVPNVRGMSAAEAADALTAAGFVVTDTVGPPNGEVLATDPPAGEVHRQGTAVIIFVRSS